MIEKNLGNRSYSSQLAIFIGLTGGGVIISVILAGIIWLMMVGGTFPSKVDDMLQPKYFNVNMVLQGVSTFFIFFFPAFLFAAICYRRPSKFLGFNLHINYKQFILIIGILVLTFPLAGALGELNKSLPIPQSWALKFKAMETAREAQEAALIQINSLPRYLLSLLMIALLPALFEETFFRGGMQNFLTRWFKGPWPAIILTSIIFSLIHLSYYGFIVRFILGIILGLIFYYSGSLWLSILFHFLFNGAQVTALYVMNLSGGVKEVKDMDKGFPAWVGIIALVLLIYLFKRYKQVSEIEKSKYINELPDNNFPDWATDQS
ncbi:MAG: CPBP family intramembrane glutamic endopeptidase [Ginsengibacter sp.]